MKPQIDDNVLIKLKGSKNPSCRPNSKFGRCNVCRIETDAAGAKKGNKKKEQAEFARKNGVRMQIKRAEKNRNHFFGELKKVLSKPDEDVILRELPTSQVS